MAIFDCCLFAGELDHLLIRCHELEEIVDHFVVVEANTTFQGAPRTMVAHKMIEDGVLDRWKERLRLIQVTNVPHLDGAIGGAGSPTFMVRERFIRDQMMTGYWDARGHDMILTSDVDEIPTVEGVREAQRRLDLERSLVFCQKMFVWSRRWFWPGPSWNTCAYLAGSGFTPQQIRDLRFEMIQEGHVIREGGWHLTWQGGPDANRVKLASFSHAEHLDKMTQIEELALKGIDINNVQLSPVDIASEPWPRFFLDHPEVWT